MCIYIYIVYIHSYISWIVQLDVCTLCTYANILIDSWLDRWMNGHDLAAHPATYEYVQYSGCKGAPTYIIPQI